MANSLAVMLPLGIGADTPCETRCRTRRARIAWSEVHGRIPFGLQVLHRCDNALCTNIDHLFLGTGAENARDRDIKGRWRGGRRFVSLCIHGHPLDEANTSIYVSRRTGKRHRRCLACHRERERQRRVTRRV